ncbi:hypothetical protein [Gloeobacter morelensis]|uniref:Short-chain dehydrogenase/reductase SDR n=1 Tax=Gloeobacter morelensis MG652769 TaxID=2781736 RepID=A0ABY3PRC6_9CYAN|nr:hypothetical protein [Gloeobacter morelensis]UFP96160.1 hypothetical protein ISF26_08120 [Gloeobacter morelensis MG652769]
MAERTTQSVAAKAQARVALVAGADGLIGGAIALALAEEGYDLVLLAESAAVLTQTAESCLQAGAAVVCLGLDAASCFALSQSFDLRVNATMADRIVASMQVPYSPAELAVVRAFEAAKPAGMLVAVAPAVSSPPALGSGYYAAERLAAEAPQSAGSQRCTVFSTFVATRAISEYDRPLDHTRPSAVQLAEAVCMAANYAATAVAEALLLTFSPADTAEAAPTLRLWDERTGKCLKALRGTPDRLSAHGSSLMSRAA